MASLGASSASETSVIESTGSRTGGGAWFWLAALLLVATGGGWLRMASTSTGTPLQGVLASTWAQWMGGAPIGWLMTVLSACALLALVMGQSGGARLRRAGWRLLYILTLGLLISSVMLIAGPIAADKTDSLPWMIVNGLGALAGIVLLGNLRRLRAAGGGAASAPSLVSFDLVLYGLTVAVLLIGPAWAIYLTHDPLPPHPLAAFAKTTAIGRTYYDTGPGPDRRYVTEYELEVRPNEVPLLGSPDADHFIFFWFDYTDPSCQTVNTRMQEIAGRVGGRVAIVPIPFPLDGRCNPRVMFQPTAQANADAGAYARLALAVWKARRDAFAPFHNWLFESPKVPSLEQARARARQLVGEEALRIALADPEIDRLLFAGISSTPSHFGARRPIPKVAWVGQVMTAEIARADVVIDAINTEFFVGDTAAPERGPDAEGSEHDSHEH